MKKTMWLCQLLYNAVNENKNEKHSSYLITYSVIGLGDNSITIIITI